MSRLALLGTCLMLFVSTEGNAKWKVEQTSDAMSGSDSVIVSSMGDVSSGPGRRDWPLLIVACSDTGPGVNLAFQSIVGSAKTSTITYKFDNGQPVRAHWLMTSLTEAYLLDNKQVAQFIKGARSASSILVRVADLSLGVTDTTFQIENADALDSLPCAAVDAPLGRKKKNAS